MFISYIKGYFKGSKLIRLFIPYHKTEVSPKGYCSCLIPTAIAMNFSRMVDAF